MKYNVLKSEEEWFNLKREDPLAYHTPHNPEKYPCVPFRIQGDELDFVYLTDFNPVPVNKH